MSTCIYCCPHGNTVTLHLKNMDTTMKQILSLILLIGLSSTAFAAGDWRGKVVDQNGEPVAYANVALLSQADSTVLCGITTEEDGTFNIVTNETEGIMMVAMLGYRTVYLSPVDGAVITLEEDATMLESAVATAVMPKTKLTAEGLQTSVHGSVLENVGNANDVLAKTPGIIKGQNGIEVIGKGSPLVYINGRKVTDPSELTRLQSNEIQSVEVIMNPGAQYDATVRSVVRIRTVRRQGDGFSFNLDASDAQSLRWKRGNDPFAAVNANYRTGGVDLFAGINYARNTSRQQSELVKRTFGKDWLLENKGDLENEYFGQSIYGNGGVNWQIADNHYLGGKIEWGKTLQYDIRTVVNDNVWLNGTQTDRLTTTSDDTLGDGSFYNIGGNLYYSGVIGGKMGLDVNLDYYGNERPTMSVSRETSDMTHDATISSTSLSRGRMYAGKAVISYPLWRGQLQAGTEETFTRHSDRYSITGIDIPGSSSEVREDNYAGFATYAFWLDKVGQFSAGVRYEYVHYTYEDALSPADNLKRDYGNWFPTLSYAGAMGPVQLMLSYSARTQRPSFEYLSSVVRYNNRYIWQSGNAQLQPDMSHNFGATAVWKFMTFMVNYVRTDHSIMTWSSPYGDEGVVLIKPRNMDSPHRGLVVYANLTPTIGVWSLNYTLGIQTQWLSIDAPDSRAPGGIRVTKFNNKPIGIAQLFNTFTLKGGWQLELGSTVMSPGYSQNMRIKNWYCDITAAVMKKLLADGSLILRLEGSDLAGAAHHDAATDFGNHTIDQTNLMDTQKVKLSLRYNFNAAQSKYRGTGAGSDSKNRM